MSGVCQVCGKEFRDAVALVFMKHDSGREVIACVEHIRQAIQQTDLDPPSEGDWRQINQAILTALEAALPTHGNA